MWCWQKLKKRRDTLIKNPFSRPIRFCNNLMMEEININLSLNPSIYHLLKWIICLIDHFFSCIYYNPNIFLYSPNRPWYFLGTSWPFLTKPRSAPLKIAFSYVPSWSCDKWSKHCCKILTDLSTSALSAFGTSSISPPMASIFCWAGIKLAIWMSYKIRPLTTGYILEQWDLSANGLFAVCAEQYSLNFCPDQPERNKMYQSLRRWWFSFKSHATL